MKSQTLLISGKQGGGKTTLANAIAKNIQGVKGFYQYQISFAEPLYLMHDFCWGLLKGRGIEMPFKKDGYLLQLLGTEWGREKIDKNIWVKMAQGAMDKFLAVHKDADRVLFIISDCRFENEFDGFPDALRIRLECPKEVRKERVSMWRETDDHPSETGLDGYALNGLFDCVFHTDKDSVDFCAMNTLALLNQDNWKPFRKHAMNPLA